MSAPIRCDIRDDWEDIRQYLVESIGVSSERPEDIYAACVYNQAHYFKNEDGFIILKETYDAFDKTKELFVWAAGSRRLGKSIIKENKDWIKSVAREIGAARISFFSEHKGLARLIGAGVSEVKTLYHMEVT